MSKMNSCIKNISVTDDDDDGVSDEDLGINHNHNNNNHDCDHTFINNQQVNCALKNVNTKNSNSNDNNNILLNDAKKKKKVRRTFSIPKNPFRLSTKHNNKCSPSPLLGMNTINNNSKDISVNELNDKEIIANNQEKTLLLSNNDYSKNDTMSLTTTTVTTPQILSPSTTTTASSGKYAITISSTSSSLPTITKISTTTTNSSVLPPTNTSAGTNGLIINDSNNKYRLFRRSTLKKMFTRIAQQMASVNIGVKHTMMTSSANDKFRVPPFSGYMNANRYIWQPDQIPGVTGLKNHGNTCFMNAVLQCLSHTDIIAEYFVLDQYKADLKKRNKYNAKKFGTKGELTEQLALVLKALWTCKNESDYSTSFKAVVDRYGAQFRSSTQHDAQEFLFWLLDKVHEDLNTASKRKYKSIKNNYGRSDEIIAAETLANHIRCNNSFVQAVFQAQFRSSLACPRCHKQSNTFDPFHCISVQLPQLAQQAVFVTVLYATQHPRQMKLGLSVPPGAPIIALREQLQADTGIPLERIVLCEISDNGFTRVFCDSHPMSVLCEDDSIYCIEAPSLSTSIGTSNDGTIINTPNTTNNNMNNSTAKTIDINDQQQLTLLIANAQRKTTPLKELTRGLEGGDVTRFGTPFCINVNRDISYTELQKRLLKEMQSVLKSDLFNYTVLPIDLFKIRLQDPSADPDTYLDSNIEHPLFTEMIDLALSVLPTDVGTQHVKFLLEWNESEKYFTDLTDAFVEHESVSQLKEKVLGNGTLTLEQCLEHYTKAETLSTEDAWRCPHCQKYLPVVKTLGLWSLPDILVIHFKRFRQQHIKGPQAAKLTTTVKFPLTGFDMSPHLARDLTATKQSSMSTNNHTGNGDNNIENRVVLNLNDININENNQEESTNNSSPWKKIKKKEPSLYQIQQHNNHYIHNYNYQQQSYKDNRYDLYAVCYHQGDTLETGHYTAACKNPYDHHWYKYDDQRVSQVPDDRMTEEIVKNEAYMLFYQRRKIDDTAECSAGSSSGSSINEHWVSKITMPKPPISSVTPVPSVPLNSNNNLINSTTSNMNASASIIKNDLTEENLENVNNAKNVTDNETTIITDDDDNNILDINDACDRKQLPSSSTTSPSSNYNPIQSSIECKPIEVYVEINTKEKNTRLELKPQSIVKTNVLSISTVTTTTSTVTSSSTTTKTTITTTTTTTSSTVSISPSPGQIIKIEKTTEDDFIDIESVENDISFVQNNSIEIDNSILGTEISTVKQGGDTLVNKVIISKLIETKLGIMNNHNTDVPKCNDHNRNDVVNVVTTKDQTENIEGNRNNSLLVNIKRKNEHLVHISNGVDKDMDEDDFNEVELRNLTEKIEETLSKSFPIQQQSSIWPIYNNRGSIHFNEMLSYHKLKQCDKKNSYNNIHNINNSKQTTNIDFQNLRQSLLSSTSSSIQLPSPFNNNNDTSTENRYYPNHRHNHYRNQLQHHHHQTNDKKVASASYASILRETNSCSKDTLLFIDQQNHNHHNGNNNIIDDDEGDDMLNDHRHDSSYLENQSLWISPVTPHKLITVSPKN